MGCLVLLQLVQYFLSTVHSEQWPTDYTNNTYLEPVDTNPSKVFLSLGINHTLRLNWFCFFVVSVPRVVVLVPSSPKMHYSLKVMMMDNIHKMVEANPTLHLRVFIDSGPIEDLPGCVQSLARLLSTDKS